MRYIEGMDVQETDKGPSSQWEHLRLISIKLRTIAYLLEAQEIDPAPPLDLEEIRWGMGMILTDLSSHIRKISRNLEKQELVITSKRGK